MKWFLFFCVCLSSGFGLWADDAPKPNFSPFRVAPLKVGITPDSAPLVFKTGDNFEGLEIDLARQVGKKLNRPVQFVELAWEDQIPALLDKRTDVIMSGMTITQEREEAIAFSDSYLEYGQMALVRSADKVRYGSLKNIVSTVSPTGVIADTTGEQFVENHFRRSKAVAFENPEKATNGLVRRQVDLFIYDSPVILWIASKRAGDEIVAIPQHLTFEYLGWGVRKEDTKLLRDLNEALAEMKADGELEATIARWLPQMPGM
ncbi:MAG: transporter substrate-binding domain-containing protein [Verrucomicrobiota bacterium]